MKQETSSSPPSPQFLRSDHYSYVPGWVASQHAHRDFWELLLVTEGTMRVSIADKVSQCPPGAIYIYPPGLAHQEACLSSTGLRLRILLWKYSATPAANPFPLETFDSSGHVGDALVWLEELQTSVDVRSPVTDKLLEVVLLECSRPGRDTVPDRISKVTKFIHKNLAEALTVRRLAQIASMSESHFAHEFRRQTDLSPMSYVRKVRLDHACQALVRTDAVLRKIALDVGFRDEFAFSRVFRRILGLTPSSLRARNRTNAAKPKNS